MASTLAKLVLANMNATDLSGGKPGVIPVIERVLSLNEEADDRRDRKFHPSDLSRHFCPRAWVLYNYHPDGFAVKVRDQDTTLRRIFGQGHTIHRRVQSYLREQLFGDWRRIVGVDAQDAPVWAWERGTFCPGPHWEYGEVGLHHDGDNITGHTDGIMRLDGSKAGLEVKSIHPEPFKWLKDMPHTDHQIQVDVYMHCIEAMRQQLMQLTVPLTPETRFAIQPLDGFWVLYECKGTHAHKQFYIPYDAERVANTMLGLRGRMRAALTYAETRELPTCTCPEKKRSALCKKLKAMPGEAVVVADNPFTITHDDFL